MNSQHHLVGSSASWGLMSYLFWLACVLHCISPDGVAHAVQAASTGSPSTRIPFLPPRNSRRGAKEAYMHHLQRELESAQRQLYVSQNTCNSLRKRWEDQRKETLSRSTGTSNEEEQLQIQRQEEEIKRLEGQLQKEAEKHEDQLERLKLMAAELKELQAWKEQQPDAERKMDEYEQQLKESREKQSEYAEEVQLLALKLEAAEFAAKQNQQGGEDGKETAREERAKALRSRLENVRAKYSTLLINSIQRADEGGADRQGRIEEEMDGAIQSAVESALESIEKGWEVKCDALEQQLSSMTDHVTSLEEERDAALSRAEEALASSVQSGLQKEDSTLMQLQMQQQRLRDELTAELTDALTEELTEKLTKQVTEKMERKYKKKYKRLRKELEEQQQTLGQAKEPEQSLEAEIAKVKEQYELEYESKLQQLQKQSEEQVLFQKERMRKLVRALLEREAKQKGGAVEEKKKRVSTTTEKRPDVAGDSGSKENDSAEEMVPVASASSSRKRKRSGRVAPVRGGNR